MSENNGMLAQVYSLPGMIRDTFRGLDKQVRTFTSHEDIINIKQVVITGCGDSHMAGVAAELAFEQLAGIPTDPIRAMKARYVAPYRQSYFPHNPLVIGISVSGTVARTREAVGLFAQQGVPTLAITANPEGPLAQMCQHTLDCTIPEFGFAPGVRSYRMSLMALYLLAIRIGEVQDRYSQDEAAKLRQELLQTADAIEATIAAVDGKTRQLAEAVANEKSFVFVGDGPNFATAMFGAAKLIEAAGVNGMGQESEEYAHLQFFSSAEPQIPTFLISPGYRGHARVGDLIPPLKKLGRQLIAIAPEGDTVVGANADWALPVVGQVKEAFSPMVYAVATELFSAHFADVIGEPFFRQDNDTYKGNRDIRNTEIITSVE
ncbi:MAG: SIS domain-containing protein [Anaerolineales bacterium]|nr:SIS domain-containing protein [Anaerolineales bacterium]MCB0010294.1 SIS domain-containing protein [Anaerolineales bacterium]MCB8962539.1 SIS domain-containing protein [Ardenticatenales bacterium]